MGQPALVFFDHIRAYRAHAAWRGVASKVLRCGKRAPTGCFIHAGSGSTRSSSWSVLAATQHGPNHGESA